MTGIQNARSAGLVTALSLTATPEYVSRPNLESYMELARNLGVVFVQINELRPVGRARNQHCDLSGEQLQIIENLYLSYNSYPALTDYPIVNYTGYHQRRLGCFGAGDRFFYVDSDGDIHVCPFCEGKVCKALAFSAADTVKLLQEQACHIFEPGIII